MVCRDWMVTTKIIQSGAGLRENDLTLCICYILEVRVRLVWRPGSIGSKSDWVILHLLWEAMPHLKGYHDLARKETKVLRENCTMPDWLCDLGICSTAFIHEKDFITLMEVNSKSPSASMLNHN